MIKLISTPLRLVFVVLLAGTVLFLLSVAMPQYNAPDVEQQLNELTITNAPKNNELYYKIRTEASTNKYLYADLGSGLIVVGISLFVFFSAKGINNFSKIKNATSMDKGSIFTLSNFAVLLLIPGTIWYYGLHSVRGEYPPWADTIAIPIMAQSTGFLIMLIPLNIYLLIAAYKSKQHALIFSRAETTILRSVAWEVFFGIPLLLTIASALISTIAGDHFLIFVSIFMVYVVLSLRAGKLGIPALNIDELASDSTYEEVILKIDFLLGELKNKINENTVLKWTKYGSVDDLLNTLEDYKARTLQHDASVFSEIALEFAESGSFRKIAMLNDWGKSFFTLADRFQYLNRAVQQKRSAAISPDL